MSAEHRLSTILVALDIAERLSIWDAGPRQQIKAAINRHGADAIWQLVDAALMLERTTIDAPRSKIFLTLLAGYRQRKRYKQESA